MIKTLTKLILPLIAISTISGCSSNKYKLIDSKEVECNHVELWRKTQPLVRGNTLTTDSLVVKGKNGEEIAFIDYLGEGNLGTGHFNEVIDNEGTKYARGLLAPDSESSLDSVYRKYRANFK